MEEFNSNLIKIALVLIPSFYMLKYLKYLRFALILGLTIYALTSPKMKGIQEVLFSMIKQSLKILLS